MNINLTHRITHGSKILKSNDGSFRLTIPSNKNQYHLAQLDDYSTLPRNKFKWQKPFRFNLKARASDQYINGTWGFGFWNDPFNIGFGIQGSARRFPCLPNAVWYFFASSENFLSLRDENIANGFMLSAFYSKSIYRWLIPFGIPFSPMMIFPKTSKILRKFLRYFIKDQYKKVLLDVTKWHDYEIMCHQDYIDFYIDGKLKFHNSIVPDGRLGCVIWIDNQYFSYPSDGKITFGKLANNKSAWIEVSDIMYNKIV